MTTQSRELLSAFLDNELAPIEVDELTQAWASEGELPIVARRYQLIGDLMRANQDRVGDADDLAAATNLAERIGAAVLEDEAALRRSAPNVIELNPPPKTQADNSAMTTARPRAFRRSLLSGVLAASIALIAVVVARFVNDTPPTFTPASNVALADESSVEPLRLAERAPSGAVQLQRYLVNHAEFSRATSQGVMPYARVVGYRNGVDERRR